jgi:hypothetical protein
MTLRGLTTQEVFQLARATSSDLRHGRVTLKVRYLDRHPHGARTLQSQGTAQGPRDARFFQARGVTLQGYSGAV